MDLDSQHGFEADTASVITAVLDPAFYAGLLLPDIEPPEVLARNEHDGRVELEVRYEYSGTLDPLARTVLGTDRISWIQQLSVDPQSGDG